MDNQEIMEKTSLKDVLGSFIGSYAERDKGVEFTEWLGGRLRQEMPDMPEEASRKLADEIVGAVAGYDKTLGELDAAIDAGHSKEEWFAEQLAETYAAMPLDIVGGKLQQIEDAVAVSNAQLMQGIDQTPVSRVDVIDAEIVPINWNEYSIKSRVYEIGNQVALTGVAVAANVLKEQAERSGAADISVAVAETLQEGLKKDTGEVKAVVAGAVKVAAEKGLEELLPEDTSTDTICDLAGAAVESAGALFDAAIGESTMTEALDKISRAGIAAGSRMAKRMIENGLANVPVVGSVLVELAGGLTNHLESPEFAEDMQSFARSGYNLVRNTAVAAWNGIKKSYGRIVGKVRNMVFG